MGKVPERPRRRFRAEWTEGGRKRSRSFETEWQADQEAASYHDGIVRDRWDGTWRRASHGPAPAAPEAPRNRVTLLVAIEYDAAWIFDPDCHSWEELEGEALDAHLEEAHAGGEAPERHRLPDEEDIERNVRDALEGIGFGEGTRFQVRELVIGGRRAGDGAWEVV